MAKRAPSPSDDELLPSLPALPLTPSDWQAIFESLGISPTQQRIVRLVLRGASNPEIIAALDMSKASVKTHIERIFGRLKVSSRMGVALCVLKASHEVRHPPDRRANGRQAND